jgi:hypothetical protein
LSADMTLYEAVLSFTVVPTAAGADGSLVFEVFKPGASVPFVSCAVPGVGAGVILEDTVGIGDSVAFGVLVTSGVFVGLPVGFMVGFTVGSVFISSS